VGFKLVGENPIFGMVPARLTWFQWEKHACGPLKQATKWENKLPHRDVKDAKTEIC